MVSIFVKFRKSTLEVSEPGLSKWILYDKERGNVFKSIEIKLSREKSTGEEKLNRTFPIKSEITLNRVCVPRNRTLVKFPINDTSKLVGFTT